MEPLTISSNNVFSNAAGNLHPYFPKDLLFCVLSFIPFKTKELCALTLTCKNLYSLRQDDVFWRVFLQRHFPNSARLAPNQSFLEECREQFRCFENSIQGRYAAGTIKIDKNSSCFAVTKDGNFLIGNGEDGSIRILNSKTGESSILIPTSSSFVTHLLCEGDLCVACFSNKNIRIWDLRVPNEFIILEEAKDLPEFPLTASKLVNEQILLGFGDGTIQIRKWDPTVKNQEPITLQFDQDSTEPYKAVEALALCGRKLYAHAWKRDAVKCWDLDGTIESCNSISIPKLSILRGLSATDEKLYTITFSGEIFIYDLTNPKNTIGPISLEPEHFYCSTRPHLSDVSKVHSWLEGSKGCFYILYTPAEKHWCLGYKTRILGIWNSEKTTQTGCLTGSPAFVKVKLNEGRVFENGELSYTLVLDRTRLCFQSLDPSSMIGLLDFGASEEEILNEIANVLRIEESNNIEKYTSG